MGKRGREEGERGEGERRGRERLGKKMSTMSEP